MGSAERKCRDAVIVARDYWLSLSPQETDAVLLFVMVARHFVLFLLVSAYLVLAWAANHFPQPFVRKSKFFLVHCALVLAGTGWRHIFVAAALFCAKNNFDLWCALFLFLTYLAHLRT